MREGRRINRSDAERLHSVNHTIRILIVCEGEISEKQYIRGFEKSRRASRVEVEISRSCGVPRTLLETCKALQA